MEVMTLEEVAKMLRVSEQTIYELARSGNLPGRKVGREWRFLKHSILEWFEAWFRGDSREDGENGEEGKVQLDEFGGEYKVEDGQEKIALWLPMSLEEKRKLLEKAEREGVNVSDLVSRYLREWMQG
ncbi:DNA binding domain protein, excisionase family [Allomeiothermus silvanus DSM 9946]|uniref:DNA binding domain protein, excisionase family n=1 Tax=Allomeiothermus silvanus (strain ATCC 700542 / DSM 9946 / NBRC 106475 / NCIMB 13440 / VI-R2) TaxID=526227 RepID=D7BG83_ALLS1|nr:helix-turn-helix domain-containing protein [Allomeiothermus silvanus]ADH62004.1 DNA binding domain protein, excisionase family [Allomeiothermus silvanus DSM 9946]